MQVTKTDGQKGMSTQEQQGRLEQSYNWRDLTRCPIAPVASNWLREELFKRQFICPLGIRDWIDEHVRGKSVLDIGIVDHFVENKESLTSPKWRHGGIRALARECWGIDILEEEIRKLRKWGVENIYYCDATSDADLGRRFEVVHVGDVIEHVDNPLNLVRFAVRHLEPNGVAFITTPNPVCAQYILGFYRTCGFPVNNCDHVTIIGSSHALEISYRADVELVGIGLHQPGWTSYLKRWIAHFVTLFFSPDFLSRDYLFIFRAKQP